MVTLSLSSELADGSVVTIWKVRNVHVYAYLAAKAIVPSGTRRLIFTLAGQKVVAGIDDIIVKDDVMSDDG